LNAARYAIAGQGLARCVCKATTEQVIGPKKKHLDYLIQCTQEANVSIPQLANLLIERTNHTSWVVVFKALVTVHHLMCHGSERFTQYLASSNYTFQLSSFQDKTTPKDSSMSTFIRRYSKYINEKALAYRNLAFDLCKIKRGTDGVLRNLPTDKLLKTIPILQQQLDSLLEFDCTANDLNNGVINAAFMQLYRDLISLYACHNDGMITILAKYFEELNKKQCKEAYEIYKKFLIQMDKVSDFLKVAEAVAVDRDNIPDLMRVPNSLLDSLGQHLSDMDSSKKSRTTSVKTAALNLPRPTTPGLTGFNTEEFLLANDEEVKKALEDEAKALQQFKAHSPKSLRSNTGNSTSNNNNNNNNCEKTTSVQQQHPSSVLQQVEAPVKIPLLQPPGSSAAKTSITSGTTSTIKPPPKSASDLLIDIDFEAAFKTNGSNGMPVNHANQVDVFGDLLQPVSSVESSATAAPGRNQKVGNIRNDNLFGGNITIGGVNNSGLHNSSSLTSTGLFKGDLDSTLANLAQNLTFDGVPKIKK
ncbi:Phosphatidylinositol-binding clathrin assembly protein LAP, partial [Fragariocoptes setiger]